MTRKVSITRNFASQPCDLVLPHSELVKYAAVRGYFRLFPVIDRRYGHTTPTMATGASASVVAIVGVVFTDSKYFHAELIQHKLEVTYFFIT